MPSEVVDGDDVPVAAVRHRPVGDAEGVQVGQPRVQFGAARDRQRQRVEARQRGGPVPLRVAAQPQTQAARVGQGHAHERAVLDEVELGLEPEHAAVPLAADLDVGDGQLDVVDAAQPGWGGHGTCSSRGGAGRRVCGRWRRPGSAPGGAGRRACTGSAGRWPGNVLVAVLRRQASSAGTSGGCGSGSVGSPARRPASATNRSNPAGVLMVSTRHGPAAATLKVCGMPRAARRTSPVSRSRSGCRRLRPAQPRALSAAGHRARLVPRGLGALGGRHPGHTAAAAR
jgi:hypothetical protein